MSQPKLFTRIAYGLLFAVMAASLLNAPMLAAYAQLPHAQASPVDYSNNPYINDYTYRPPGPEETAAPAQPYQSYRTQPAAAPSVRQTVTYYPTYGPSSWSPAAKILTGTGIGAVAGGAVGLATGLTLHATSRRPVTTIRYTTNVVNNTYKYGHHYGHCRRALTTATSETQVVRQAGKRMNMSRGSAAARGLGWGALYGATAGLVGGIAYAYFTRDPVAVSSSTYR